MESIWSKTINSQIHPTLMGDYKVEVAVIGGGMAGLLTAYFLKKSGMKPIILEADRVGQGQTKNTTAKITSQHALIYTRLMQQFGTEKALQYAQANQQAIGEYSRIIEENQIDCNFETAPAYLYSIHQQNVNLLEQEAACAQQLKIPADFTTQTNLPFSVAGAVKFHEQAQFHPLRFLQAISDGLTIFEQTKVKSVEGDRILTEHGTVTARQIVFATHFPFLTVPGFYFARMHQARSYVLALQNAGPVDGMYLGIDPEGLSLRNFGNTLLLGGGSHRTGENSSGGKYQLLRAAAKRLYPQSKEIARWSAQDCITLDGVPYIGQFSTTTPNWYVATGFGKWGMTSSMVSAMLLSDLITGKENPYSEVFSPLRFTPSASAKAFLNHGGQAVKGLTRELFKLPTADIEALPCGHGGIIEYQGQKLGVYKNEKGECSAVSTRCPHLGCQLEWNPDEKSWDCPCHGSRFDPYGRLLDNPAQENLEGILNE